MIEAIYQPDKQLHFLMTENITALVTILLFIMFPYLPILWLLCLGIVIGMIPGIYKERLDKKEKGNHWCWLDLLADLLGAITGAGFVTALITLLLRS